jgi:transmembrane sensor
MDRETLEKFLYNNCNEEELNEIIHWFESDASGINERDIVRNIWEGFSSEDVIINEDHFELILDKIHHRINLINNENQQPINRNIFKTIGYYLVRAAAVLFIPLLISFLIVLNKGQFTDQNFAHIPSNNIEIVSPIGSRTYIELPDGTGVHLNHGSKLSYPQKFSGRERTVTLDGEAYFKVASDTKRPFRVEAANLVFTALGTEFNVMAYQGKSFLETALAEGRVLVQEKQEGNKLLNVKEMEPGHLFHYNYEKNAYSYKSEDIRKYISWKDGVLIFRNDPLIEITDRLGRWYNVDFVFKNDELKNFPYTATFVDETLLQILDLLQMAAPMKYEVSSRIKQADGTFSKPQITIDLKQK